MSLLRTLKILALLRYLGVDKLLTWPVIVIVCVPLIILAWNLSNEEQKKISSQGQAEVKIDTDLKLPIVDLSEERYLGDQKFHAAILHKNFLVRGVETTVIRVSQNANPSVGHRGSNSVIAYSDILDPTCLRELQSSMGNDDADTDLGQVVPGICGDPVYPNRAGTSTDMEVNADNILDFCKNNMTTPCAECIVFAGRVIGGASCEPRKIEFVDKSRYTRTGGEEWYRFEWKPVNRLSYMRYPPQ